MAPTLLTVIRKLFCDITSQVVSVFPCSGVTAVALSSVGATSGMCQSPVERLTDQVPVSKKPSVVLYLLVSHRFLNHPQHIHAMEEIINQY